MSYCTLSVFEIKLVIQIILESNHKNFIIVSSLKLKVSLKFFLGMRHYSRPMHCCHIQAILHISCPYVVKKHSSEI